MTTVSVRRHVQASPARVWSLATDVDRWTETMSGIERIEVLAEPDFGVGTRWRETRTLMGKQTTEEMWVTAVDDGRSYTVESDSHGAHYVSVFTFSPTDGGTDIELSFTGQPTSGVAKALLAVTGPFARRSVMKALQQDLDDLAVAAERPGA